MVTPLFFVLIFTASADPFRLSVPIVVPLTTTSTTSLCFALLLTLLVFSFLAPLLLFLFSGRIPLPLAASSWLAAGSLLDRSPPYLQQQPRGARQANNNNNNNNNLNVCRRRSSEFN